MACARPLGCWDSTGMLKLTLLKVSSAQERAPFPTGDPVDARWCFAYLGGVVRTCPWRRFSMTHALVAIQRLAPEP